MRLIEIYNVHKGVGEGLKKVCRRFSSLQNNRISRKFVKGF